VKHLTTRLAVLLMLALMIITGAYDYVRLSRERDRLVEITRGDQRIFAETLALAVRRNLRRGRTTEELQELLDEIGTRPGLVWVAIFNPKGDVIAAGVAAGAPAPSGDDAIDLTLNTGEPTSSIVGRGKHQILRYVQPFRWPDGRTAAVEVRHSLADMQRDFAAAIRDRIAGRLVILVFFVLAIVAVTRWSIARPIQALIRAARAVGSGDLTQRIELRRADELGVLAEEFNRMAENLQGAHEALVEQSEERLRLEREVQQTQKLAAVGMLAAEVAHEVGTPLNVVSGRAEALERAIPRDHPERRHLDVIVQQTDRIAGIIRSLLDYTRPRRSELRPEAVPPILARVASLLESRYRSKRARIALELPEDLPRVMADADQLQQLFINLLGNALDASPPDSAVEVTTGREVALPAAGRGETVRGKADAPLLDIHIVDRGPGMTADELVHVFEPFFSTKKRGQGTGLGLPIVEEIIRAHRGEVAMLSVPGEGTEVIVRLPLAPEDTAPHLTDPQPSELARDASSR
jgi:two-component system, NtrC family, sensor histidine kinase HydH